MNIIDIFTDNFKYFLIFLIAFFGIIFLYHLSKAIKNYVTYNKKVRLIILDSDSNAKVKALKAEYKKPKKTKIKENAIVKLYKEYMFFDGTKKKFIFSLILGYVISFVIFFVLSQNYGLAAILSIAYFDLFYIFIDRRNEKQRKRYIRSFSLALRTLTASVEAGNSFEEAVSTIIKRDTIGSKIRTEFAYINNGLKSNKSLEEVLNDFWARNNMFTEFSMFVIVMQFYSQKGGDGLAKILIKLEKTLEDKVESYSEIDTELGIHKTLMNVLIYGYFVFLLGVKLFMPGFYIDIAYDSIGYLKALGSVALLFVGTVYFKNMVRTSAEG